MGKSSALDGLRFDNAGGREQHSGLGTGPLATKEVWCLESGRTADGGEVGDRFQKSISGSQDMCRDTGLFKRRDPWAHLEAWDWLTQRDLMQVPTAQVSVSLRDFPHSQSHIS